MPVSQDELDAITLEKREPVTRRSGVTDDEINSITLGDDLIPAKDAAADNMRNAYGIDTEKEVQLQKKARELGLPENTTVSQELIDAETEKKKRHDFSNMFGSGGMLGDGTAKFYSDPKNSKAAWDDWEILNSFEKEIQGIKDEEGFWKKAGGSVMAALSGIPEKSVSTMKAYDDLSMEAKRAFIDYIGLSGTPIANMIENKGAANRSILDKTHQALKEGTESWRPETDSTTMGAVYSGIESAVQSTTSALFLGPKAVLGMGAMEFGASYGDTEEKDMTIAQRLVNAGGKSAIEVFTEVGPMKRLNDLMMGKVGDGFFKEMFKGASEEIWTEQVATAGQDYVDWATLPENKDKPFSEYLLERPAAAYQTLVSTLVSWP